MWEKIKGIGRDIGLWLLGNSFWLLLLLGTICLVLSHWPPAFLAGATNLLSSTGSAILSGGIFAVILKSIQFLGIFREELAAMIYERRFLEGRKDVENIWREVSRVLYKRKFPEISDEIEKRILEEYFPTKKNCYYDRLIQSIRYEFLDDTKRLVRVEEELMFTVKPAGASEKVEVPYGALISKDVSDTEICYELSAVEIDGDDETAKYSALMEVAENDEGGRTYRVQFALLLEGKEKYEVKIKHLKICSPDFDNTKVFTVSRFIRTVDLTVTYPAELEIDFFSMGTAKDFESGPGDYRGHLRKMFNELLFPSQGYRLIIRRRHQAMLPVSTGGS